MAIKYQFVKVENTTDDFELVYEKNGEKRIPFKRSIKCEKLLQGITARARMKMFKELTAQGMTKNDFIVKTEENGKISYDESNFRLLEERFVQEESVNTMNDIIKLLFNMDLVKLLAELELTSEEDGLNLATNLLAILNKQDEEIPSK